MSTALTNFLKEFDYGYKDPVKTIKDYNLNKKVYECQRTPSFKRTEAVWIFCRSHESPPKAAVFDAVTHELRGSLFFTAEELYMLRTTLILDKPGLFDQK